MPLDNRAATPLAPEARDRVHLALAPNAEAGSAGSGNFDANLMYVSGPITAAEIDGHTAVLKGSATVTERAQAQADPSLGADI